jgi:hypothetical protein
MSKPRRMFITTLSFVSTLVALLFTAQAGLAQLPPDLPGTYEDGQAPAGSTVVASASSSPFWQFALVALIASVLTGAGLLVASRLRRLQHLRHVSV